MPYQNIDATLSETDRDLIRQKADEIAALLPFAVNLAKGEKRKSLRLGAQSEKFFIDILKIIKLSPVYKPAFVNDDMFGRDVDLYVNLLLVENKINELCEMITDTRSALAQEMMKPGLAVYANIKQAARANVPGADTVLSQLQPYFKKERKKK